MAILDIIDSLSMAQSTEEVAKALVAQSASLDVANASHRVIHSDGSAQGATTMPEAWISHYKVSGYDKHDPGAQRARSFVGTGGNSFEIPEPGEVWTPTVALMNSEIRQLHVAGSMFVANSTAQPGAASMVNYITEASGDKYHRWVTDHGPRLRLIGAAAHARICEFKKNLPRGMTLTPRERVSLLWLAEGHRVDRIAEKMGLSNRTIEVHLANARQKLGAKTREQALAIALTAGLLGAA